MVDGINSFNHVRQSDGNSRDSLQISKDKALKSPLFPLDKPQVVSDDSTSREITMFGGGLDDVSTIDGGELPEVVVTAPKPEKDVATIDGGELPEVVVIGEKPKILANNSAITQDLQANTVKHKKGFFAWLGRTLGLTKS